MKQVALSIDEMKHLESLGLDTSGASMCYRYNSWDGMIDGKTYDLLPWIGGHSSKRGEFYPAYTLHDILNVLSTMTNLIWEMNYCSIWVMDLNSDEYIHTESSENDDMLLNAYNLLLWCIENNYIKTNKVCGNG